MGARTVAAVSDPTVTWDETRVSGPEPLAVRVSKKLRNEEALITEYSGARLRMDLDRVPLWRGDHVSLKQLWSDYSQYLYLPRLADSAVLLGAVRSGAALLTWNPDTFAYASAFSEATNGYSGLVGGQHAGVVLDATSVLVKPEVAARQMAEDVSSAGGEVGCRPSDWRHTAPAARGVDEVNARHGLPRALLRSDLARTGPHASRSRRHRGRDRRSTRSRRRDGDYLGGDRSHDSDGFPDDVRRTVSENARTLKFEAHEFEE